MAARRSLQLLVPALLVVAAMLVPSAGRATGGRYASAGGTPRQQAAADANRSHPELIATNTRRVEGDR